MSATDVGIDLARMARCHFDQSSWEAAHMPFFGDPDPGERTRIHAKVGLRALTNAIALIPRPQVEPQRNSWEAAPYMGWPRSRTGSVTPHAVT